MLGFIQSSVLMSLIPLGVMLLGVFTFEIAMAVTISTLPRSRFQQKWTPREQRRVLRVFIVIFSIWPTAAVLILAHVYLPIWAAVATDLLALALFVLAARWLMHGIRQRKLILAGHCMNCFYDLRANKESDHCPECGIELQDHPTRAKPPRRRSQPIRP